MDRPCQVIRLNAHLDDDNWKFVRSDFPGLRKDDGRMDGQESVGSPSWINFARKLFSVFLPGLFPLDGDDDGKGGCQATTDNCCNIIPWRSALRFHHGKLSWAKLLLL